MAAQDLADFEVIQQELSSKFECLYNGPLFYCYVKSDSLDPFPPLVIRLERITLTLKPEDYITFVRRADN